MSPAAARRDLRLGLLIAGMAVIVATEFIVGGRVPVLARGVGISLGETGRLTRG